jgi:hypothetical protein
MMGQVPDDLIMFNLRAAKDARDAATVFMHVFLPKQAVVADRKAMVAGKENERVLPLARFAKEIKDPSKMVVVMLDHAGILPAVFPDGFRRAGEGKQQLIPDGQVTVVPWINRHEVVRQAALFGQEGIR